MLLSFKKTQAHLLSRVPVKSVQHMQAPFVKIPNLNSGWWFLLSRFPFCQGGVGGCWFMQEDLLSRSSDFGLWMKPFVKVLIFCQDHRTLFRSSFTTASKSTNTRGKIGSFFSFCWCLPAWQERPLCLARGPQRKCLTCHQSACWCRAPGASLLCPFRQGDHGKSSLTLFLPQKRKWGSFPLSNSSCSHLLLFLWYFLSMTSSTPCQATASFMFGLLTTKGAGPFVNVSFFLPPLASSSVP